MGAFCSKRNPSVRKTRDLRRGLPNGLAVHNGQHFYCVQHRTVDKRGQAP
jgi:hypothetical protein